MFGKLWFAGQVASEIPQDRSPAGLNDEEDASNPYAATLAVGNTLKKATTSREDGCFWRQGRPAELALNLRRGNTRAAVQH